ncbi:MAG: AlpA family phage regulatory protein [Gammaproteobacteria bacterium]|nr:AlpA family phage regulatory protein [Gammaproteobacteria bacterium]
MKRAVVALAQHSLEILRIKDVIEMTGLSRTSIWRRVKQEQFPQPLRLGGPGSRAVGWHRSTIEEWGGLSPSVRRGVVTPSPPGRAR